MAQPDGHPVVLEAEEARQAEERYQKLLEEVNQARELNPQVEQEKALLQEEKQAAEYRGDWRSRAQAHDMAQLTAELIACRM